MSEVAQPVVIPSTNNADELAQMDMLLALDRVQHSQDAESAKVYVERALATGLAHYPYGVVRAIEQRLPEATPSQIESLSLLREKATGNISFGRVIGAFGNVVLVLLGSLDAGNSFKVILLDHPCDVELCIPDWDITRPEKRRIWLPAEEVSDDV